MPVPATIAQILDAFDAAAGPLPIDAVSAALNRAFEQLGELEPADKDLAWGECVAFFLATDCRELDPWQSYFGPWGSDRAPNGEVRYQPEVRNLTAEIIEHWIARAAAVTHPVLKARYADLVWDLGNKVDRRRSDRQQALTAATAYLDAIQQGLIEERILQINAASRALDLACSIGNRDIIARAKDQVLALHDQAVGDGSLWWKTFDRLIFERNAGLTEAERDRLVASLEDLAARYADAGTQAFDPFELESIGDRLIAHYRRRGSREDVRRVSALMGDAFGTLAGAGAALQAMTWFQWAENAYREAGQPDDADRMRIGRQEAIRRSRDEMQEITITQPVPRAEIDAFLAAVIRDTFPNTLFAIAVRLMLKYRHQQEAVQRIAQQSVLQAMIPMEQLAGDHVAAVVGSVEDDLDGRICQEGMRTLVFQSLFLDLALERAIETHDIGLSEMVGFVGRSGLFDDLSFVIAGLKAWLSGDRLKALFVLVPQFEKGIRELARRLGRPVTKRHPTMKEREVSKNLGDLLSDPTVKETLGEDLILHFRVLYSDSRGHNLRNEVAHGLTEWEEVNEMTVNLVIHSFLLLGCWEELAAAARDRAVQAATSTE